MNVRAFGIKIENYGKNGETAFAPSGAIKSNVANTAIPTLNRVNSSQKKKPSSWACKLRRSKAFLSGRLLS